MGMNVLSRSQQSLKNTVSQKYLISHLTCPSLWVNVPCSSMNLHHRQTVDRVSTNI